MIVCTSKSSTLLGNGFGKDRVTVARLESIIDNLSLDPKLSKPTKEAFIVSSDDIRSPKLRKEFMTAAAKKHKDVIVIYISRVSKSDVSEGNGINKVLIKPKTSDIVDAVNSMVESIINKEPLEYSESVSSSGIDKYIPEEFIEEEKEEVVEEQPEPVIEEEELPKIEYVEEPVQEEAPRNSMADRIRSCGTVSDIKVLTEEMKSSKILKDLIKENQQFAAIEDQLRAMNEKIRAVMLSQDGLTLEEKLSKVEGILVDKDYYRSKTNSIIEQRVEEIITTLVDTVKSTVNSRLAELDKAISNVAVKQKEAMKTTRLAGLDEERGNLILELSTLSMEIRKVFMNTDDLACDIVSSLAQSEADLTGSEHLNARLTLQGNQYNSLIQSKDGSLTEDQLKYNLALVSGSTVDTIINVLRTADKTTEEFEKAISDIEVMQMKLNKLLELDNETIMAYRTIDKFLRENNIEDTVYAETLIKKSMRIFVGEEGTGRTAIPLVLSAMKSKSNANTMLLDLTGTSKFPQYGVQSMSLSSWMDSRAEKEFCVVEGEISNPEYLSRVLVALTKAAEYYRVINIIVSPEQRDIFDVLAPDALSTTYIVDTSNKNISSMREVIKETKLNNVARKVIINRALAGSNLEILEKLELLNVEDVRYMTVPYIQQISECGLRGIQPFSVPSILTEFQAVSQYA